MFNQALIQHLESFIPLKENEKALFEDKFVSRLVKRKEKILTAGEVCKQYTFIVKGCFRMYGVDDKGFEHNIQFAAENDWIADISSFYTQKTSQLNIEALEASELLQIKQQDLFFLFTNVPKLNRIFKVMIEHKYIELQNRVLQNFSSTAEQRYLGFLEQYPHLSNRLPNTQIASYLGITPEFLSKVRKNIQSKA
ncbi:cAMP-binding domain of CRP or a regulatory subunit of cAMP-dependent protein kinases [Algoriphagus alkaliphilus]|uniref:cAMP-binding domain of CRP or a regulatory subunit of cAMP-dependent protein kinases n=1 Tax=Algoriphagus alkaliphilus TaxID=279824 RepID=A0A1G5WZS1_9BACT|nr:Crp/Fnr family transcriptional regulator [Algoriphagus alkaliphilus]MBA4299825.1 Crp/Fnr family transcriptional regulator [Cyclobacterium sp.]SDA63659.1 cAMP-binding domain of CRP or a regulatory subunit of cAMP-dependent protein kinases [Algoriphagus alkaliphilus]